MRHMAKVQLIHGILAELDSPESVLEAATRVRQAGYQQVEAYTPIAVQGLPEALGQQNTRVAAITLGCGLLGALLGFGMCWYANVIS